MQISRIYESLLSSLRLVDDNIINGPVTQISTAALCGVDVFTLDN